jgi:hypothetical protein
MASPVACSSYTTLKRRLKFNGLYDVSSHQINILFVVCGKFTKILFYEEQQRHMSHVGVEQLFFFQPC